MLVTIFTPTYNRKKLILRLYNSIVRQTDKNFEWIIVDDGSNDGTDDIVKRWINKGDVNIKYFYQNNHGKHSALNFGVQKAKGEMFFCVDSDDYLIEDAISILRKTYTSQKDDSIAGIVALKSYINGEIIGQHMPNNLLYANTYELSDVYKCGGDKSMIYRTDILKQYPYPVIDNEKFITECVVFDQIAKKYKMFLLDTSLTVCEYQDNGLTSNIVKIMINNPTGYKIYYSQRIDLSISFKSRLGYALRYCIFDNISKDRENNYTGKHKLLVILLKPFGYVGKYYYYRKSKK